MKKQYSIAILALVAAIVGGVCQYFGLVSSWQEQVFDRFFTVRHAPSNIVIVGIDDQSLTELGGWPLARKSFATVLTNIGSPRAIGIDVAFIDPSARGVSDDASFASALLAKKDSVVLATQYDDRGGKLLKPLPLFSSNAREAYANVLLDSDGGIRTLAPIRGDTESLSTALAEDTDTSHLPSVVRVDWQGPAGTFLTIPFIDVYRGTAPASVFLNKTVLIGVTAKDLHDVLATPLGVMSGVEVHANALATLNSKNFFSDVSVPLMLLLILCVAYVPAITIFLVTRLVLLIALLAIEFVAINLASVVLFSSYVRLPTVSLSITFLLSVGFIFIYQYLNESREKRQIRKMFQLYLMPEVIDELAEHPELLSLGGQEKTLTILFCDIRGFTTLSEGLSPPELTSLINEYLTAMTDAIMETGGLVDKYIGDAVMAFWGAPLPNLLQESAACRGALAMMSSLDKLNSDLLKRGKKPIHIGIGISTGEVVVGNMGSSKRFNYTVMGDEVNFASRLEGLTKAYGITCVIGERTAKAISGDTSFTLRELDFVMVKGKKEPRTIYQLFTGEPSSVLKEQFVHFMNGRASYIRGDWDEAIKHFKEALLLGEDGPSQTFLDRAEHLMKNPPDDWKGIWEFTTK
ncbi:MAG: CHASE2 domain-containing protein [Minisyncoccia bacterium]